MCQISIKIPDAVLYDTHMGDREAASFAKRVIALHYYTQYKISVGYCAQIADMAEEDFIKYLGENNISIFNFSGTKEFIEGSLPDEFEAIARANKDIAQNGTVSHNAVNWD